MSKFAFLSSTRFWAIVLASASTTLVDPSFMTVPWYVSLGKFLGLVAAGFTVVRTVDRMGDKKVEAAKYVEVSGISADEPG